MFFLEVVLEGLRGLRGNLLDKDLDFFFKIVLGLRRCPTLAFK